MHSYHFDIGDSSSGPIGYCARVTARSRKHAVQILKNQLRRMMLSASMDISEPGMEYLEVYFNDDVTKQSIDEVGEPDEAQVAALEGQP